ncbi:molybdopterin-binding protein, partial [Streptomyces sp. NPDC020800]
MRSRFFPPVFKGRLHDARTATSIGRWLGLAFAVCFCTGLISHFMQHPP